MRKRARTGQRGKAECVLRRSTDGGVARQPARPKPRGVVYTAAASAALLELKTHACGTPVARLWPLRASSFACLSLPLGQLEERKHGQSWDREERGSGFHDWPKPGRSPAQSKARRSLPPLQVASSISRQPHPRQPHCHTATDLLGEAAPTSAEISAAQRGARRSVMSQLPRCSAGFACLLAEVHGGRRHAKQDGFACLVVPGGGPAGAGAHAPATPPACASCSFCCATCLEVHMEMAHPDQLRQLRARYSGGVVPWQRLQRAEAVPVARPQPLQHGAAAAASHPGARPAGWMTSSGAAGRASLGPRVGAPHSQPHGHGLPAQQAATFLPTSPKRLTSQALVFRAVHGHKSAGAGLPKAQRHSSQAGAWLQPGAAARRDGGDAGRACTLPAPRAASAAAVARLKPAQPVAVELPTSSKGAASGSGADVSDTDDAMAEPSGGSSSDTALGTAAVHKPGAAHTAAGQKAEQAGGPGSDKATTTAFEAAAAAAQRHSTGLPAHGCGAGAAGGGGPRVVRSGDGGLLLPATPDVTAVGQGRVGGKGAVAGMSVCWGEVSRTGQGEGKCIRECVRVGAGGESRTGPGEKRPPARLHYRIHCGAPLEACAASSMQICLACTARTVTVAPLAKRPRAAEVGGMLTAHGVR